MTFSVFVKILGAYYAHITHDRRLTKSLVVLVAVWLLVYTLHTTQNFINFTVTTYQCFDFGVRGLTPFTKIRQESPAVADKPARRESMPKIAPIRRAYNVVADNTGLSSFVYRLLRPKSAKS